MGKGEIARYEQFLLFPQCFQKASFPGVSNSVIVWEWVEYNTSVVMVLAIQPGGPGSNPDWTLNFCHAFIHFFLRYELDQTTNFGLDQITSIYRRQY